MQNPYFLIFLHSCEIKSECERPGYKTIDCCADYRISLLIKKKSLNLSVSYSTVQVILVHTHTHTHTHIYSGGTRWSSRLHGDPVPCHAVAGTGPSPLLKYRVGVNRPADQGPAWHWQQIHYRHVQVSHFNTMTCMWRKSHGN